MNSVPPRRSFLKRSIAWLDARLPLTAFIQKHITHYYLPANLNGWYVFGALSLFFLALQFFSGFWLMMFYTPTPEAAFNSIESLMRDVPYGWFIRYLHSCGASFFLSCFTRIYYVVCSMAPIKNRENWFGYWGFYCIFFH